MTELQKLIRILQAIESIYMSDPEMLRCIDWSCVDAMVRSTLSSIGKKATPATISPSISRHRSRRFSSR